MDKKEISALIKLLDDTDVSIFNNIRERLVSYGRDVIPVLEDAWSNSFDVLIQERIENIIHRIQFEGLKKELVHWASTEPRDLLAGAILVARYQYPDLDEEKINTHIGHIRRDTWIELNENLTALEQIRVFNHVLFDVYSFSGNTANFHAPQNNFINIVLESRKGNPLSLSILYAVIANRLDLPVYGINLPEHFILAYKDTSPLVPVTDNPYAKGIHFYINPFSKGTVFGYKEIDAFLKQLKMEPKPLFYQPCSNTDMIIRLLRNLANSYQKAGYTEKMNEAEELLNAVEKVKEKKDNRGNKGMRE